MPGQQAGYYAQSGCDPPAQRSAPGPLVPIPSNYRKLCGAPGIDGGGTPLPLLSAVVPGQGLGELPELRTHDRSRIDPTKATGL
jgi:hypothetical protein